MSDAPAALSDSSTEGDQADENLHQVLEAHRDKIAALKAEVGRIFIGPEATVESLLVALLARGHILLEGVPGVAKTTLVRAFARTLQSDFKRIQFTPDLLPADITGTYIPNLQTNEFVLRKGPIFANILLGDEINRAPAKTQSALLEAMQERQVTIEGRTHSLEEPFLVLATQNPVEQEGVYPLPEAQLDRFLLKIKIGYPTAEQEFRVMKTHQTPPEPVRPILDASEIEELRQAAELVHVSDELTKYIIRLSKFTREHAKTALGASPRASLALLQAAKARSVVRGRDYVLPDDVRILAAKVLSHRLLLLPEAELSGLTPEDVVAQALQKVRYSD
ncbi:MAG: AAA family ATPase [Myxococcota bacterium]